MNLLAETLDILNENGKSKEDVLWVGGHDYHFSWNDFEEIAEKTDYDAGFGAQEVASDLIIVGEDFWLERSEYDGSEGWEFNAQPNKPKKYKKVSKLAGGMWDSLNEINND